MCHQTRSNLIEDVSEIVMALAGPEELVTLQARILGTCQITSLAISLFLAKSPNGGLFRVILRSPLLKKALLSQDYGESSSVGRYSEYYASVQRVICHRDGSVLGGSISVLK